MQHIDYYEDMHSPEDFGWIHEDDVPDIGHCRDMIEGLVESVYQTGNLDQFEFCLDELCFSFGISFEHKKNKLKKLFTK